MCVPGDTMDLLSGQLGSGHVSDAWMTWSEAAEVALASAHYLARGPPPPRSDHASGSGAPRNSCARNLLSFSKMLPCHLRSPAQEG